MGTPKRKGPDALATQSDPVFIDTLGGEINCPDTTEDQDADQAQMTRQKRWQAANPQARWAHLALASALRHGLVERQPCRDCGDPQTDGHHPDYSRPADVVWLCRRHHVAEHARLRRENGGHE